MSGRKISKKEVVRLVKKYKKSGEKKNSISAWFSLANMQEIVKLIGDLTDSATGKTGDGVRVYFSRYPNNVSDPEKKDKNTVVFVPTYSLNGGTTHHDYISAEEVKKLSEEIGDPDTENQVEVLRSVEEEEGELGFNHAELCPSHCDGGTVGGA